LIFGFAVTGLYLYKNLRHSDSKTELFLNLSKTQTKNLIQARPPNASSLPIPNSSESDSTWSLWLHQEADQIGHLTDNPERIQKSLELKAKTIPASRLEWLKDQAKNTNINADERLLAIEYISLSPLEESLDRLEDIALAPINSGLSNPLKNEALMLKAAAVEAFSNKENFKSKAITKLNEISEKTEDPFLLDRAQRSLWHLKGKAKSPADQDIEVLKKLTE
jgi:hypothetical protein